MSSCRKKQQLQSIANARLKRWPDRENHPSSENKDLAPSPPRIDLTQDSDSDGECGWDGTVNHYLSETSSAYGPGDSEVSDTGSEYSEVDEGEVLELVTEVQQAQIRKLSPYEEIKTNLGTIDWKKAERKRGFGYTGNSVRTRQRNDQAARDRKSVV